MNMNTNHQKMLIEKKLGPGPYDLLKLLNFIQTKHCQHCGELLQSVSFYKHEGGIWLKDMENNPNWVYSQCPNKKCEQDIALWKLCQQEENINIQQEIHGVNF